MHLLKKTPLTVLFVISQFFRIKCLPCPLKVHHCEVAGDNKTVPEAATGYGDSFSEIILTQSALDEVDRRAPHPRRIAIEVQQSPRSGEFRETPAQLNRAVRQGGLDLRHLRGVRYAQSCSSF